MFKASNSKDEVKQESEFNSIAILKELKQFFVNNKHQNLEPQDCERYNRVLEAHNAVLVYDEEERVHRLWVNDEPLESEGAIQMLSAMIKSLELSNAENTSRTSKTASFTTSLSNTDVQEQAKSDGLEIMRDKIKVKGGIVAGGPVHFGGVHTVINNPVYINHIAGEGSQTTTNNPVWPKLNEADLNSKAAQLLVHLKASYSTSEYTSIPGIFGPPLKLEGQYINLQILCTDLKTIKPTEDKESEESKEFSEAKPMEKYKDARMASVEDLFGDKRVIKMEDLFKPSRELFNNQVLQTQDNTEKPRLLLVQGRAGIGKTTFVHYVAHQWSRGQLYTNYTWVFTIALRKLRLLPSTPVLSLSECIRLSQFSDWEQKEFEELWNQRIEPAIQNNQVLLILDGYDETPEHHSCESILKQLLTGSGKYANLSVLMTTRPIGTEDISQKSRNLEIIGFTDENINEYIQAYFAEAPNKALVDILTETLRKQSVIWANAHIPLNLNLLCGIMEDAIKNINVESLIQGLAPLSSMTCMYQIMEKKLYERSYTRREVASPNALKQKIRAATDFIQYYEKERFFLAELAFESFKDENIIISLQTIGIVVQSYIKKVFQSQQQKEDLGEEFFKGARELGLIKTVLDTSSTSETKQDYEFLHLTFQEYYTAIYLASQLSKKEPATQAFAQSVISKEKYNPRWQIVWWFVAGLLRENTPVYQAYLRQLQGQSTVQKDIFEHYPLGLLVRCIDESFEPQNQQVIEPFVKQLQLGFLKLYQTAQNIQNNDKYFCLEFPFIHSLFFSACRISPNFCMNRKQDLYALFPKPRGQEDKRFLATWIGNIRVITPKALDILLGLMVDEDYYVRDSAAEALGNLGEAAATPNVLDMLLRLLIDQDRAVSHSATKALSKLGKVVAMPKVADELLKLFSDEDKRMRLHGADIVYELGEVFVTPKVVDMLLRLLSDEDQYVRCGAAKALLSQVATTSKILDVLQEVLADKDEDEYLRGFATNALGNLDKAAVTPKVLDMFLGLLTDKSWQVLSSAADALGKLGEVAVTPKVLDTLQRLLVHERSHVRGCASIVMGNLGETVATPKVLDILQGLLADKDEYVRRSAAEALGKLGKIAATPKILDMLLKLLMDEGCEVGRCAGRALGNMGEAAAIPKVLDRLSVLASSRTAGRGSALVALHSFGVAGAIPKILDVLLGELAHKELEVRGSAAWVLGNLGQAAVTEKIMDALQKLLADKARYVYGNVVTALMKLSETMALEAYLGWLLNISSAANNNKILHFFEARIETVFTLMPSFWVDHANHPNILAFVSHTLAAAYLNSRISCQIDFDKEGETTGYCVRGVAGKSRYCFLITEEQAQSSAHLSSLIIEQLSQTGKLDITNLKMHLLKRKTISLAQNLLLGKKEAGGSGSALVQNGSPMLTRYQQGSRGASEARADQNYREVKGVCRIS